MTHSLAAHNRISRNRKSPLLPLPSRIAIRTRPVRPMLGLLLAPVFALVGCGAPADEDRTRARDALLSPQALAAARSAQDYEVTKMRSGESDACADVDVAIAQLSTLGSGLLNVTAPGRLEVDEGLWGKLAPSQRKSFLQALAVQSRCRSNGQPGEVIVRSISRPVVLERYREQ